MTLMMASCSRHATGGCMFATVQNAGAHCLWTCECDAMQMRVESPDFTHNDSLRWTNLTIECTLLQHARAGSGSSLS